MTHLNDLSKAYLEQIAEKKKDDTYLEPDMKKRQANNEKARKDLMKGPQMKNPHFEEKQLDPVGQEDGDVNNDGKKDSTDKYLMKRRKAIGKAMKKESFVKSNWRDSLTEVMNDIESQPIKEKKVKNKVVINPKMSEAVEEIGGTLIEEIEVDDIEGIVECVYGELIEEGYTEDEVESAIEQSLTEAKITYGHDTSGDAESMRDKLKKKAKGFLGKVAVKAYNKAREAKVAATPAVQRAKTSAKRGIKKMAQKVVDRMSEEIIGEASYTAGNEKPFPYGKVGDKLRKVAGERDAEKDPKKRNKLASRVSKMNREYNLPEAVYGGTKKPAPTDKRLTVTNADKAGNTPAYQAYKAGDKRYKAADHMKEGVRDMDPEKGTAERKARLEKKRGMKLDDHPQYKKEEVEQVAEADSLAAMAARREKRLAAQRKKMGTSSTGQDFGHDYGISSAERKKRQQAEFDKFVGRGKKTTKEEVENVDEVYKGKHGQSDKEYADSRSQGGKMVSGDSKRSGAEYTHGRRVKAANPGMQPDVGGKTKPKSQGKMDAGTRADLQYRKANMRKEEASMSQAELQLQKKKARIDKMIAMKRAQGLSKMKAGGETPAKAMGEGLSVDDQMRISQEYNRKSPEERKAANMKAMSGLKKGTPKKDTRTDAQKMTDATGPRPGSRYRGD